MALGTSTIAVLLAVAACSSTREPESAPRPVTVTAAAETDPVPSEGDAADDPAIWIHPSDPSRSTIIGTDKDGGLAVYDLGGTELQYDESVHANNVDLRYGFPLGGAEVTLVAFSNAADGTIGAYTVDEASRRVRDVAAHPIDPGIDPVGLCLFRSPTSGRYYAFVVDSADGDVEQWELFDDGTGSVDGAVVRRFSTGSNSEGCVADDANADVYVSEQSVGIWRYGAEPDDGDEATLVDAVGAGGHLTEDVEGLAIYATSNDGGYLIASSQGADSYQLYERPGGAYVGTFEIVAGALDGVDNTDGIDVTNAPLGPAFPEGLFVAQDGDNLGANQNFKLVPWGRIAGAFRPALEIDTGLDPRAVQA